MGLCPLVNGLWARHQSFKALAGHALRLSEHNIGLLPAMCSPYAVRGLSNLDFCKAARTRIYIYQGDKAVATGGFEPQTPDASGSSEKHLGIQSPRILIEEDEANVLIENRMLGQNWS